MCFKLKCINYLLFEVKTKMFESTTSSLTSALKMNCLINEKQELINDGDKNKKESFRASLSQPEVML